VQPVACTRFCEQPGIPTIGGTKNPDVPAIVALAPDLVVVNDEENRREDFEALVATGVAVHSMSPRSIAEIGPAVVELAAAVGAGVPAPFGPSEWPAWVEGRAAIEGERRRCVAFVWRRPWMTLALDTYGAGLLALLGLDHVEWAGPDRYPEVSLDQVAGAEPDVILLPSEPYVFAEKHRGEVESGVPGVDVRLVDGQDLFWWGIRTPDAVARLRGALAR